MPHNEHKPNNMFTHYGVHIVPRLTGLPIVQVRMKYNHHMAQDIMSYIDSLCLGCRTYETYSKKGTAQTDIHLEFEGSDTNWLKYDAFKNQVQILQKEIDLRNLKTMRDNIINKF